MNGDMDDGTSIAIIGLAGRFPGASCIAEFWRNLRDGVESVTDFGAEELSDAGVTDDQLNDPAYVRSGAVLDGIDRFDAPFFGYSGRDATLIDPQQRLFLECAWHALEDAGHPPGRFEGSTGVYAAANMSTYLLANVLAGRAGFADVAEALELIVANDKDYLANRVAFKLGLDGPAVAVQAACSSSLVAVHLAAQALLADECDMALAGGVAIRVPHRTGYRYREGLIFSPSGHCRPFDAGADGTIAGNGLGVVVLRRLADAIADGDRIDAVIRGSAVNNDGGDKAGYTAPSVSGQARAVASALGVAGIDPASVTAIETHGTGTRLGDPIEITALTKVFGAGPADQCALGAVKSNIGHLDSAAGIAGLIKAVLQLKHGELVPSLNYERPNPEIDFARTPFYVNTELRAWKPNGTPRRIGVSSFGMGGTNAHVVLEEAPERPRTAPSGRALHLLPISAGSAAALAEVRTDLAEAIAEGDAPIEDVAYTLRAGRGELPYRDAVVAGDTVQAAETLRASRPPANRKPVRGRPRTVWLFTGQGSQYPGMGRGLYDNEPVFRDRVDRCAELFTAELGCDLLSVLYPDEPGEEAGERLRRTEFAQPALFTVEYALAGQFEHWGVRPDAMIGHSIGEVTAACVAGVLSTEDAVRLVARRGTLMQGLPAGAMLAVAMPEQDLRALLPERLSLAAVNGPGMCVVSGPSEEIAGFQDVLRARDLQCRPLHTSHAFHSVMMEPVLGPFTAAVADLTLNPPQVPYVANRTGDWVTGEQATDPEFWAGHVRDTVRFGDAVQRIAEGSDPLVLLELGPGDTLCLLARQCREVRRAAIVSSLPGPDGTTPDHTNALEAAGRLWSAGISLNWDALAAPGACVGLPGHAFQRRSYWIAPAAGAAPATAADSAAPAAPGGIAETDSADAVIAADPRPELDEEYVEPRDDTERRLAAIWEDVLGVAPVGVHDGFIELGGHSLLATELVERIAERFGRRVPLEAVLRAATVAELAVLIESAQGGGASASPGLPEAVIDPAARHEPFPLSEMQQAQWIGRMASFAAGDTAAHVYWEVDQDGLDLDRLSRAWNRVVDRHDMLRAVISRDGTQRILPDPGRYEFATLDLRDQPADTVQARLTELRDRLSHEVRPTDVWPLFDIRVTLLPDGRARLHIGFDLLIADIGSIRLLLADWRRYYADLDAELPPIGLSYRDYVLACAEIRDTDLYRRAIAYWRERVAELPPAPDLPLAVAPAELNRPEFTARTARLDADTWAEFSRIAAARGLTPSAALLAAYATAIGTWTRSGRFTLNVTVINRLPVHPDVGALVGEFASFDLLPVDLTAVSGIADLAHHIQEQSWADLEHRYVNGVEILRELARHRGGTSGSVMPVVFTSTLVQENDPDDDSMFGWLGEVTHQIAQTPQVWLDFAVLTADRGVELTWHWITKLFPEGMLEQIFDAFHRTVVDLAGDAAAWAGLPGLVPGEQRALMKQANATEAEVPDGLLYAPLVARAITEPGRTAVIAANGTLTFGELYRQACGLAHRLRSMGVGPNQLVAVAIDKSREQPVAALAVQLAGGAYLPVDPDLPRERQDYLIEHGQARVVLTRAGGPDRDWPAPLRRLVVDLDADPGADEPPEAVQRPDDLAYVIYTSGSTGAPKGVMVAHRAALNTVLDINERFDLGAEDRVLGLSSLSFDLSVWDVFGVLGAGGTLVLPPAGARRSPHVWLDLVRQHGVTLWNSVPALAQMFVEHAAGCDDEPVPIRLALLSGDWIPLDLPDRMRAVLPRVELVSLGGATEAAIWSIAFPIGEVDPSWDSIPYGRPLRNQTFQVLNDRMEPCPVWVTGELYIGGAGVADGYWRDPERTAASFVTQPASGERLYRTGDLGRWRPDGNIEFLGREDFQVKIGGYRIELGEIEAALLRHPEVAAAVVTAHGADRHHRRLVGYLVATGERPDDTDALVERVRAHCAEQLPSYMVPAALVVLERLPLSGNGKVDRAALPDPGRRPGVPSDDSVTDALTGRLAELIADVVGIDRIGPAENFFELGGDSITGVQIVARANAEGIDLALQDLFEARTVGALAAELADRSPVDTGWASGGHAPLTAHQRMLFAQAAPDHPAGAHRVELRVGDCVEPDRAGAALGALAERHPALRLRFAEVDGELRQVPADAGDQAPYVPIIDLSGLPSDRRENALTLMTEEMRGELDIHDGPVTKMALFVLGGDDRRLVWLTHELVADGPSWKVLTAEFFQVMGALDRGTPLPPPPLGSFPAWVCARPPDPAPPDGRPVYTLHTPPDGPADSYRVPVRLSAEETASLLDAAHAAYRMTLDEVVLATVVDVLRGAGYGEQVTIDVEFDPRDGIEEFGAARVVGPFTCLARVGLRLPGDGGLAELLTETKRGLRAAVESGDVSAAPGELLVRCLGDFTAAIPADDPLAQASREPWPVLAGRRDTVHSVTVSALIVHDGLRVEWVAAGDDTTRVLMNGLARAHAAALARVGRHCRDTTAGDIRSSDFPLAGLDDDELAAVLAAAEEDQR